MTSHSDRDIKIATIQKLYDSVAAGDRAGVEAVLDPECTVIEAEGLPYAGVYKGHTAFHDLMTTLFSTFSSFEMSNMEYIVDGDAAVATFALRGTLAKTGKIIDQPLAELWRFREGKLLSVCPFYFDTHAVFVANS